MRFILLLLSLISFHGIAQNCALGDISVSSTIDSVCPDNNGATITTGNTQLGFDYYLINTGTSATVDGPFEGTGAPLNFSTGVTNSTTTYAVVAELPENALNFDGIDDEVNCGTGISFTNEFTLEAWVRQDAIQNWPTFVSNIDYVNVSGFWLGSNDGAEVEMYITSNAWLTGTTNIADGNWHHVAGVFRNDSGFVYTDGILEGAGPMPSSINSTVPLTLGNDSDPANYKFNGDISEVRIWNVSRSTSEINANMNSCLQGNESGLLAYYVFEDGAPSSNLTDRTGNGNTGTLVNMDPSTDWVSGHQACCMLQMTQEVTITYVDAIVDANWNGTLLTASAGADSYQWLDCDNGNQEILGETGMTYTPQVAGNYAVLGTYGSCVDSSACISAPLSTTQLGSTSIHVYPNPSNTGIFHFPNDQTISEVEVRDLCGRIIEGNFDQLNQKIDIEGAPEGTYILRVETDDHIAVFRVRVKASK